MSFSATILFSPPHPNEAKCCCCTCKQEPGAPVTAPPPQAPSSPPCTPITITGTGLSVQSSEQLLHIIYQRVEKAVSLAELALSLARANNEALRRLEEDVAALRRDPLMALKASPLQVPEEPENEEELEAEEFGNGVQVVIEELKQLGAASAAVGRPEPLAFSPMPALGGVCTEILASIVVVRRGLPVFKHQLSHLAIKIWDSVVVISWGLPAKGTPEPLSCPEGSPSSTIHEEPTNVEPHFCVGFAGLPCRSRNLGQKNARRKRDLVLSKLVHNVHNHIANEKRFDGAESIKSSWNISVVKFLLEKLKHELVSNHHNYTDKELKGELSEYRNSLNPFKGLKEKEEKKLRSRRYRVRQLVIPHVLGMSCLVKRRIGVCVLAKKGFFEMTIRALVFPILLLLTRSDAKEFYSPSPPEKKSIPNASCLTFRYLTNSIAICTTQVTRGHRQTSKLPQRLYKRMQTTLPTRKLLWHQRL
uniref:Chromosome 14 open reading frame 93 n=1 Tax=Naja naja TaxID=35670 RepID=A0A8C6VQT4_NAJNA